MADQSSEFAELVQEALLSLPQGGSAELVEQDFDEENFGNAVATLDLRGLRFRFARDRGFVTVDVGHSGEDAESFPLEDLAAKLGWLRQEELVSHVANSCRYTLHFFEDGLRCGSPHERLRGVVVALRESPDLIH